MRSSVRTLVALASLAVASEALADAKTEAQAHVDRAKTLHGEGKLAEALAALKDAYVLDPRPELLFAIGQIHVGMGQCTEAITYYERFLSTKPSTDSVSVTQEAIKACKTNPPPVKPKVEPPKPPPPPPPEVEVTKPWYSDVLGDALVGGGLVVGVTAALVYRSARGDRNAADDVTSFQRYSELVDDAQRKRTYAVVLGVAGVGLIAGGAVRLVMKRRETDRGLAVVPVAGGSLVMWTVGF